MKGRAGGQGAGQQGSPLSNTAAPEIIKRRGTIIKMFAAVFQKLPRHGRTSTSTHKTDTHMPIYICVWPGTFAYLLLLLLLLGRLINWLLKVLKIENKILRYQNKIPARVRGRGGSATPAPSHLCPAIAPGKAPSPLPHVRQVRHKPGSHPSN